MRRRRFNPKVLAAELARRGNRCAICGEPFADGDKIEWDHTHQLAMGGADEVDNLRPAHGACHLGKSRADAAARGKVRRLTGQTRKRRGPKIRTRGFNRAFRKRMNGQVEKRE